MRLSHALYVNKINSVLFRIRESQNAFPELPHPGCFKNQDPEKYCLNHNDPVICKTIRDICDADGFVKPEDIVHIHDTYIMISYGDTYTYQTIVEDGTGQSNDCWIDGYDAGFAGKMYVSTAV